MEEVQPVVTGMQFGVFDNNGCGSLIRDKLELVTSRFIIVKL
jgi:hypothetical protein